MSTHAAEKLVVRETGWSKAGHLRGKGVRTCIPALESRENRRTTRDGPDSNIVKGDD